MGGETETGTASGAAADRPARERLLRVAADLFARKGYAATSVGEIVAAADVTKPVLYYHFESKAGLYRALVDGALVALRPEVETALRGDGRAAADRIRRLCDAIVAAALANPSAVRLMRALHYAPPQEAPELELWEFPLTVMSTLERLVRQGVRTGEFDTADPSGVAWAVLGLLSVCVDSNVLHPKNVLTPAGFRSALDLVLAGAAPGGGAAATCARDGGADPRPAGRTPRRPPKP